MTDDAVSIGTVLLDLDGVVRHFDADHVATVEQTHGLSPGSLFGTAFEPSLIDRVVTGQMTKAAWRDEVGARLGSPDAARAWMTDPGTVDDELLDEVDVLRSRGVTVAILTNGTDAIPGEMVSLGLDVRFDAIFNSAEIGHAKPDRRAFEHVCRELVVDPVTVFFTDDSAAKLAGAVEIGMAARRYEDVVTFRQHLLELGLSAV